MTNDIRPLAGVRVLDLASGDGTFTGLLLDELGADVLLLEPAGNDATAAGSPNSGTAPAEIFRETYLRRGRTAVIDPADRAALDAHLADADIVLDDASTGLLERHGLSPAGLAAARPDLIAVSITPYGRSGPRAGWRGTDLTTWAAGGAMWLMGAPERAPLWAPGQARHLTGFWSAIATLAALHHREATGRGQWVDLSRQETVIPEAGSGWLFQAYEGTRVMRQGKETHFVSPCPIVRARDGFLIVMVVVRKQWTALARWLVEEGCGDWLADARYNDIRERLADRDRINDAIAQLVAPHAKRDVFFEGQRRGIPVAMIQTPAEVLNDPHLAERGFWLETPAADRGAPLKRPGPHYRLTATGGPDAGTPDPAPSVAAPAEPGDPPLAGLRILDLTWVLAGPFGTRILGDLGADVIKVEPRGAGDGARWNPPFAGGERGLNRGGLFNDLNHNKRCLSIDLKDERGLAVVRRLATEWADVVIENFAPGTLERLGLDPAGLTAANPRLTVIRLSAFGQTGEYRDLIGYAPPLQALAGLTGTIGYPPDDLMGVSLALGDYVGGMTGALLTLAALRERSRSGRGVVADVSQFEGAARLLGPALIEEQLTGRGGDLTGNRDKTGQAVPHGVFPAAEADRWVALAVTSDAEWQALTGVLGSPEWTADADLTAVAGRRARIDEVEAGVRAWTQGQPAATAVAALQAAGIPASLVHESIDLLENEPHLAARGYFQTIEHPECGPVTAARLPFLLPASPPRLRRPAPLLGEHNEEVLREILGYSQDDIDALILDEVI